MSLFDSVFTNCFGGRAATPDASRPSSGVSKVPLPNAPGSGTSMSTADKLLSGVFGGQMPSQDTPKMQQAVNLLTGGAAPAPMPPAPGNQPGGVSGIPARTAVTRPPDLSEWMKALLGVDLGSYLGKGDS